jgi:hypothetical protein
MWPGQAPDADLPAATIADLIAILNVAHDETVYAGPGPEETALNREAATDAVDGPLDEDISDDEESTGPVLSLAYHLNPDVWFDRAMEALTYIAQTGPVRDEIGVVSDELLVRSLRSYLEEPLGPKEAKDLWKAPAEFWNTQRFVLKPLAAVCCRLLSVPATEAQCERIFGALRRTVFPHGYRMGDVVVAARLAACFHPP